MIYDLFVWKRFIFFPAAPRCNSQKHNNLCFPVRFCLSVVDDLLLLGF
jgi:hypothetical protein